MVQSRKGTEMHDFRLVAARQLVWNKEAWRQPAYLGLVIRTLQDMLAADPEDPTMRAELESLIKRLYAAGKAPA